ncbi:hypothetical protein FACS189467_3360 [Bacteroidia bacterium]|nr:hypothetical protein FACS189467_3360 [Bacteroidia bacterium]
MDFKEFKQYFSETRANRYVIAAGNSTDKAIRLYKANLKIAQAFHPLLGILEVALRNRLNDTLADYFTDPDWILNQKTGFMVAPSLTFVNKRTGKTEINSFLEQEVVKAERKILKTGKFVISEKIVAEQTMGFWTELFEITHYRLLKGTPIQIFKTLPTGVGRKEVSDKLGCIRRFRNRINHNEPICFVGNSIDFTATLEVYNSILHILSWMDVALVKFVADMDKVQKTIATAKKIQQKR